MPVVLEEYAELIDYNFGLIKEELYQQYPSNHQEFMRVETMDRAFIKRDYLSGLGIPQKNRDTQNLPWDQPVKGYPSTFVPTTYRLGYQIDRESVEDEQWGLLASRPKSMVYGSIVIKDMVATDILNNGLVLQSYDLGGTSLFSTANVREDGGGTWANLISEIQPITTETVFNAIVSLLTLLTDSRGLAINFGTAVNIYVPMINPELWEQAIAVTKSMMNPGTTDNRINSVMEQFQIKIVPLRYATDANLWFIGWAPNMSNYGLVLFNRVEPTISPLKPFGDNEDVFWSRLRMRFTAGYENKRGLAAVGA